MKLKSCYSKWPTSMNIIIEMNFRAKKCPNETSCDLHKNEVTCVIHYHSQLNNHVHLKTFLYCLHVCYSWIQTTIQIETQKIRLLCKLVIGTQAMIISNFPEIVHIQGAEFDSKKSTLLWKKIDPHVGSLNLFKCGTCRNS